jgi:hypothetical protein
MSGVNQNYEQQGIYKNKIIILDNAPDTYSRGSQFKSQLEYQMS